MLAPESVRSAYNVSVCHKACAGLSAVGSSAAVIHGSRNVVEGMSDNVTERIERAKPVLELVEDMC
jgi:hypothetical protein